MKLLLHKTQHVEGSFVLYKIHYLHYNQLWWYKKFERQLAQIGVLHFILQLGCGILCYVYGCDAFYTRAHVDIKVMPLNFCFGISMILAEACYSKSSMESVGLPLVEMSLLEHGNAMRALWETGHPMQVPPTSSCQRQTIARVDGVHMMFIGKLFFWSGGTRGIVAF